MSLLTKPIPGTDSKTARNIISLLAFSGIVFCCHEITKPTPEEQARRDAAAAIEKRCGDEVAAYVMAKHFVSDQLKNPAGASYASMVGDSGYSSTLQDNCTWTFKSYVDATNGFGATIRTPFTISVKRVSGDEWQTTGVAFGGR